MRVFTIESGEVAKGTEVEEFSLKGAGATIPAVIVGEQGRGRELGVLPISGCEPGEEILFAEIGKTRSGRPKLIAHEEAGGGESCIVVFRTHIGFRGGNSHTGDRLGWACSACQAAGEDDLPRECPECGATRGWYGLQRQFAEFPGEILVEGRIAQGQAGGMGSGQQLVVIVPRNIVFRTGYTGRLYGRPPAHYYVFDGEQILSATWEERTLADLF